MKAAVIHDFGGIDQLAIEDVAVPKPADGEVLIDVQASGINPIDFKTRNGMGVNRGWGRVPENIILGWDISGVVVESQSDAWRAGDAVFGMPRFPALTDGYAEFVTAPGNELARKPNGTSHLEAAAVPLAALTAWQALFDNAGLENGQHVLIHAGAGGVGHLAIQLAKWKGAHVTATCSSRNTDFVMSLGADDVIDYTQSDFSEKAANMDVVFHMISPDQKPQSFATLKEAGFLASITGPLSPEELEDHKITGKFVTVRPNGAQMQEIASLMESGALKVHVDAVYSLADIAQAHGHVEGGHTRGKVVLDLAK